MTAFEQVLSRQPTATERERCEKFLDRQTALLADPSKLTAADGEDKAG